MFYAMNAYPYRFRPAQSITSNELILKNVMRSLWEQHVAWTRMTIISIVFGLPDLNFVITRLLRNATDMGNSLRPYYGDAAADTYHDLIKEHLILAADLVKAAKNGRQKEAAAAERKWYANADKIVDFWGQINPYIAKEEVRKMFYEHLALTKEEAVTMIKKDYASSIALYDRVEAQALGMADAFSNAIVKQFPQLFG